MILIAMIKITDKVAIVNITTNNKNKYKNMVNIIWFYSLTRIKLKIRTKNKNGFRRFRQKCIKIYFFFFIWLDNYFES